MEDASGLVIYDGPADMNRFETTILKYIRENDMIPEGSTVVTGLSGGADSVCLLLVLCALRRVLKIRLLAVHVHHGLRGAEADRDEAFCRELAGRMETEYLCVPVDVRGLVREQGLSEEEAARILRYKALEECLGSETDRIAVAHHADDQAETILMNLARGSGLRGLGGMQPVRDRIVRPLLATGREEILKYLAEKGESYCTDSTNLVSDHTRNLVRNEILPLFTRGVNTQTAAHITAAGRMIREADELLRSLAVEYLDGLPPVREEARIRKLALGQTVLKEKPQLLRRYVIIEGLRRLGVPMKDWGEVHFADTDRALFGPAGYHLDLPGGVRAENVRHETYLYAPAGNGSGTAEMQSYNIQGGNDGS